MQGHYFKIPVFMNPEVGPGGAKLMLWWEDGCWWITDCQDDECPKHIAKGVPPITSRWLHLDETEWHMPWWRDEPTELLWVGSMQSWQARIDKARVAYCHKLWRKEQDMRSELAEVKEELNEMRDLVQRKETGEEKTKGGYMNKLVAVDVAYTSMKNFQRVEYLFKRYKECSEVYSKTYEKHKKVVDTWGWDSGYNY